MKRFVLLVVCLWLPVVLFGGEGTEARLTRLAGELRCLVCQNETLADSRAELAEDLRREIRSRIEAGHSDQEIRSFLTERYGDFILYRPPLAPRTAPLWFGPFLIGAIGFVALVRSVKNRSRVCRGGL